MKTCTVEGCSKPNRARGLCVTHYNQQHQPDRHRKVTLACAKCGAPCEKEPTRSRRYKELFCSLACRNYYVPRRILAARKLARAARGTHGQLWVGGDCHCCGMAFVGAGASARYCSSECWRIQRNRRSDARGRARRAGIKHVPYSNVDIFRRDRWTCHLCLKRVRRDVHYLHPLSPTIDHLIPVSVGGDDAPYNVKCAHRSCNTKRGVKGTVQLLLIG